MTDGNQRELFFVLLQKDLKIKYKGTVLGYAWSLLLPLMQSLIFFVVFSLFLRFPIADYFLFLSIGFVVWQFFSNGLQQSATVLLNNSNLIRKTRIPRYLLIFSSVGGELVHLLVSLPVLLILMLCCHRYPSPEILYALPCGLLSLVLFTAGLGLMIAVVNTFFRDLERILQILLQIWFYVTPIFYSLAQIPEKYHVLLKLNPVFYPVMMFRGCFYEPMTQWYYIPVTLLTGLLFFFIGCYFFIRTQQCLAEEL